MCSIFCLKQCRFHYLEAHFKTLFICSVRRKAKHHLDSDTKLRLGLQQFLLARLESASWLIRGVHSILGIWLGTFMISRLTFSCSHLWKFVYRECMTAYVSALWTFGYFHWFHSLPQMQFVNATCDLKGMFTLNVSVDITVCLKLCSCVIMGTVLNFNVDGNANVTCEQAISRWSGLGILGKKLNNSHLILFMSLATQY